MSGSSRPPGEEDGAAVCLVYITVPDGDTAVRLAEALVKERLASCVNILGPVRSVYRWAGAIERAEEVALLAKTRASGADALSRRVAQLHPYECPCILVLPVSGGHPAFLDEIRKQTGRWASSASES